MKRLAPLLIAVLYTIPVIVQAQPQRGRSTRNLYDPGKRVLPDVDDPGISTADDIAGAIDVPGLPTVILTTSSSLSKTEIVAAVATSISVSTDVADPMPSSRPPCPLQTAHSETPIKPGAAELTSKSIPTPTPTSVAPTQLVAGVPTSSPSPLDLADTMAKTSVPCPLKTGDATSALDSSSSSTSPTGNTCAQDGPHSLVKCLYEQADLSRKVCSSVGGGCSVLAEYLPISSDDELSCWPDVEVAAQVCAQCDGREGAYATYDKYLDMCRDQYPMSNGTGTSGNATITPSSAMAEEKAEDGGVGTGAKGGSSTGTESETVAGGASGTGEDGGEGSKTTSLSASHSAQTTPGSASASALDITSAGVSKSISSSSSSSTIPTDTASTTTNSAPAGIFANEGLLTTVSSKTSDSIKATMTRPSASAPIVKTTAIGITSGGTSEEDDVPITEYTAASSTTSTSSSAIKSATPTSLTKQQLGFASNATDLFFAQVLDPVCGEKDDGCTTWQAAVNIADGASICAASNFKGAADCSSCIGAAGGLDQIVYKAQMEAYGWYRNNCTLATGGKNNGNSTTTLNAVEEVDPVRPSTPGSAATGVPVALSANAGAVAGGAVGAGAAVGPGAVGGVGVGSGVGTGAGAGTGVVAGAKVPTGQYAEAQAAPAGLVLKENGGGRRSEFSLTQAVSIVSAGLLAVMLL